MRWLMIQTRLYRHRFWAFQAFVLTIGISLISLGTFFVFPSAIVDVNRIPESVKIWATGNCEEAEFFTKTAPIVAVSRISKDDFRIVAMLNSDIWSNSTLLYVSEGTGAVTRGLKALPQSLSTIVRGPHLLEAKCDSVDLTIELPSSTTEISNMVAVYDEISGESFLDKFGQTGMVVMDLSEGTNFGDTEGTRSYSLHSIEPDYLKKHNENENTLVFRSGPTLPQKAIVAVAFDLSCQDCLLGYKNSSALTVMYVSNMVKPEFDAQTSIGGLQDTLAKAIQSNSNTNLAKYYAVSEGAFLAKPYNNDASAYFDDGIWKHDKANLITAFRWDDLLFEGRENYIMIVFSVVLAFGVTLTCEALLMVSARLLKIL